MTSLVHIVVDDHIATITLDSPDNRNALSQQLLAELDTALRDARDDSEVRAVVLTATGTTFCSGADLSGATSAGARAVPFVEILSTLWTYPKTVIARLNGHVRAGGFGLVAAADIVIAPTSSVIRVQRGAHRRRTGGDRRPVPAAHDAASGRPLPRDR